MDSKSTSYSSYVTARNIHNWRKSQSSESPHITKHFVLFPYSHDKSEKYFNLLSCLSGLKPVAAVCNIHASPVPSLLLKRCPELCNYDYLWITFFSSLLSFLSSPFDYPLHFSLFFETYCCGLVLKNNFNLLRMQRSNYVPYFYNSFAAYFLPRDDVRNKLVKQFRRSPLDVLSLSPRKQGYF